MEVRERGTWEVPVGGIRGETEGNDFLFQRVSGAIEVVNEKMTSRPTIHRLMDGHCCHLHKGRMGIWKHVKYLYLVGWKFCRWNEILNLATVQVIQKYETVLVWPSVTSSHHHIENWLPRS